MLPNLSKANKNKKKGDKYNSPGYQTNFAKQSME